MDFYRTKERSTKSGTVEVYPDFEVVRSNDLMVRGKSFYAIWDESKGLWSTDEFDVQKLVDNELWEHRNELAKRTEGNVQVKLMANFSSNSWRNYRSYIGLLSDSSTELDKNLTFANTVVKKSDFVSKRLPYSLAPGDHHAWDEIVGTLYDDEERAKIEWAIGAIVSGDSKKIQKFLVWYGAPGTGKGTVLDIIQKLFVGYYTTFEAKTLTGSSAFAMEAFKTNPLVAIDPDGDLSKIEDNTRLNSLVSHEPMTINEKFKPSYTERMFAMLLVATNKPVKFTDAKSGLGRRMIDVRPSGNIIPSRKYGTLVSQIDFELGAIAQHCLEVYRSMGRDYYSGYRALEMMLQTDVFFNFIEAHYDTFQEQGGVTLQQAHKLYKEFCDETGIEWKMPQYKLRDELKNYFNVFEDRALVNGVRVRSWYSDFNAERWKVKGPEEKAFTLVMDETHSIFDDEYANKPAQYSKVDGSPQKYWTNAPKINKRTGKEFVPSANLVVDTILSDLDTTKEHYVKPPSNHIVIDFDLKDATGEKNAERNLEAASKWPPTYAEFSKSGAGVHLHYNYDGDTDQLARIYDENIEIKVFSGDSSLRRRLSKCNNVPVATISTGLPTQEKKMMNKEGVKSEKALRDLIIRIIRKEVPNITATKPGVDFIHKILDDAYYAGLPYDITDLRNRIMVFANSSTNQSLYCLKLVMDMKFKSADVDPNPTKVVEKTSKDLNAQRAVIFDCEVFPNLLMINWKYEGTDVVVRMINPTPQAVEELINMKLVGFNNRKYDNHILYGRFLGYDNEQIYELSKKLINNVPSARFGEAYNISYADILEFSSKKQSLKKFQIELNIPHKELGLDWDKPVPEEMWDKVGDYCDNDVNSTEAVYHDRKQDLVARQILAELSGLAVNETTQVHTAKIIFGNDKKAQEKFIYTDLSEMFPGYQYEMGVSTYRGEVVGEGGYVYSEPGMYTNCALLDVQSMHPASIAALDAFGPYTENFNALVRARVAIKHGDYELAGTMLNGALAPYLGNKEDATALSYALKIIVNIVYGMTSAKYDNPFRDVRNKDNIVAKRGALFMIDLKHFVQDFVGKDGRTFSASHIKTDSIKIPDATPEIIEAVMEFGEKYGYIFEHEATYEKFCLVNKSVYIAKVAAGKKPAYWDPTGKQFAEPYVFKKLFSKEPIAFEDYCVPKFVTTALYLDFTADSVPAVFDDEQLHFVGKAGKFCPIVPGGGGGMLVREKEGKYDAATGSKGYLWMESEMVKNLEKEDYIDKSYFENLVDDAISQIKKYGDFEWFVS